MVFYVESLYIAKSIHAYSPSLPSFSGLEMGIAPPTSGTPHIYPGVTRHAQHQTSTPNIPPFSIVVLLSVPGYPSYPLTHS